jgi:hypothetical protein
MQGHGRAPEAVQQPRTQRKAESVRDAARSGCRDLLPVGQGAAVSAPAESAVKAAATAAPVPVTPAAAVTASKASDHAAKTVAKPKPARYVVEEELEPEEAIAAAFIERIAKEPVREPPKATRTQVQKSGREKDSGRGVAVRGVQTPYGARPGLPPPRAGVRTLPQEPSISPDRVIPLRGAVVVKDLAESRASGLTV